MVLRASRESVGEVERSLTRLRCQLAYRGILSTNAPDEVRARTPCRAAAGYRRAWGLSTSHDRPPDAHAPLEMTELSRTMTRPVLLSAANRFPGDAPGCSRNFRKSTAFRVRHRTVSAVFACDTGQQNRWSYDF